MRKFFMIMAAMAAMFMSAHTNDTKVFDATYVTIKGGVTALMHPGCNGYENFGHTFESATSLQIGKWITPHLGISIDGTNGWTNGSKFGTFQDDYAVNYVTVAALAKYRFMPFNKFNIAFAAGPEWIHGFNKNAADNNDIGTKMQIEFNYNLTNKWQLNVVPELNYNFTRITGNQPRFDSRNAWYGLMAGITYNFGNKFTTCDKLYTQSDIDNLNSEINDLRSRQPEIIKEVEIIEKIVTAKVPYAVVMFDKNSAELSDNAKNMLNNIDGPVTIVGSASPEGTELRNKQLASDRANAVANYLRNNNVDIVSINSDMTIGSRVVIIK